MAARRPPRTSNLQLVEGHVKRHPDGFGFLIPVDPDFPDVYLPKHTMNGIMSNDVVRARVTSEGHDRYRGEVNEVVKRAVQGLIGTFTAVGKDQGIILDREGTWGSNVLIPPGKTRSARDGQLVHVKIQSYATWNSDLSGDVVEVLGDTADPLIDAKRVLVTNQIPTEFLPETLRHAHDLPKEVLESEKRGRKDLRNLDLITIDGVTAKDFDDAVCVMRDGSGFRLWVAIADVSHYVRPGTPIDKDAYQRGTSVYFPGFVVPMLPEQLSNELCSLKPKVDRLALVCEVQINFHGDVTSATFYEAVICSKARVTYGEAQEVIDGANVPSLSHVKDNILRCSDLAKILLAKRFQRGSLDLEIPETQILLDDAGHPTDIVKSERLFAHRLIEELMLVANVSTAKFLSDAEIPAIYRIHEEPFEDSLATLNRFLTAFGANTPIEGGRIQKKINRALEAFHGKPQAEILHILTLRSMKQAKYSPNNVGHFGLGFEFYTHFTSPIRRYPDLIVHRLVKSLILKSDRYSGMSEDSLATAGTLLSACEQRSTKAERQFNAIKKARFMKQFLGREYDGMISSVAKFGVFVLLREFDVDGLLKADALGREEFEFDEELMALVGRRSGLRYSLGDAIRIQVVAVDTDLGRIDFGLGEPAKEVSQADAKSRDSVVLAKPRGHVSRPGKARSQKKRRKRH